MKIAIEIKPNKFTRFLGSQALKVKTGASHARSSVQSYASGVRNAYQEGVRKAQRERMSQS